MASNCYVRQRGLLPVVLIAGCTAKSPGEMQPSDACVHPSDSDLPAQSLDWAAEFGKLHGWLQCVAKFESLWPKKLLTALLTLTSYILMWLLVFSEFEDHKSMWHTTSMKEKTKPCNHLNRWRKKHLMKLNIHSWLKKKKHTYKSGHRGNLPDGPMIKTSPSKARDEGSIRGQEDLTCLGAKKLNRASGPKS